MTPEEASQLYNIEQRNYYDYCGYIQSQYIEEFKVEQRQSYELPAPWSEWIEEAATNVKIIKQH